MRHDFTALFLASGMGLGALGFRNAAARLGSDSARFKILGGVDFDAGACADFEMLTGTRALQADLHELTPADLRQYAGDECPDAVFSSAPCKGFSRLLGAKKAAGPTYQRMNDLVYRCIMLSCETWDRPAPLIALENVPGIMSRGAKLLERCRTLLHHYGYHLHEGTHDCGEIGDLAQHRKRYLLVARQPKKVTAFVHKPPLHKVRACGEVLSQLPVPIGPEGASAGVLHALPKIAWVTWVKLALIPAGGDHRDLPKDFALRIDPTKFAGSPGLYSVGDFAEPFPTVTASASVTSSNGAAAVADPRVEFFRNVTRVESWEKPAHCVTSGSRPSGGGMSVADPRVPTNHPSLGVMPFDAPAGTVQGESLPSNGRFSVADPRCFLSKGNLGVLSFDESTGVIAGGSLPHQGRYSVADPRLELLSPLKPGQARREVQGRNDIRAWDQPARTVAGTGTNGGYGLADPRPRFNHNMRVSEWAQPCGTVTPASRPDSGGASVSDPRVPHLRNDQYGVLSWQEAAGTITGNASIDNGRFSAADPRKPPVGPLQIIISADACWHRPLTTLELGLLQGLPAVLGGKPIQLAGTSSLKWRERIGNAVPEGAGKAMATSLLLALLASKLGTWFLSNDEIWVRHRDFYAMPEEAAYGC